MQDIMLETLVKIPDKAHLTVRLSPSADKVLDGIVSVAEKSKSPVVIIMSVRGPIRGTFIFSVKGIDGMYHEEVSEVYGVPIKELELFRFLIPLDNEAFHVTPLAAERIDYLKASKLRKYYLRTPPIHSLFGF